MAKLEFKGGWFNKKKSKASTDVVDAKSATQDNGKSLTLPGKIEQNVYPQDSEGKPITLKGYANQAIWNLDMSRVYHFTVQIDQIPTNLPAHSVYSQFLPVKTFKYSPMSVANENVDLGAFINFPLIKGREVGTLDISLVDTADRYYEKQVAYWYARTAPADGYAPYLEEIIGLLTYRSYNNLGTQLTESKLVVMPTDAYEIERDPEKNELNTISFKLAVVGVYSELSDYDI